MWKWTRDQYMKMAELGFFTGKRVELIRGVILEMSPVNWPHILATVRMGEAIRTAFGGTGFVIEQGSFPLADSDPVPDTRAILGHPTDYADNPSTAALIVEVSDSTIAFDLTDKAELYASAGVQDYWVLDLNGRVLHVFRDPQPNVALGVTAYRTLSVLKPGDVVSPLAVPNATINVSDLLP